MADITSLRLLCSYMAQGLSIRTVGALARKRLRAQATRLRLLLADTVVDSDWFSCDTVLPSHVVHSMSSKTSLRLAGDILAV